MCSISCLKCKGWDHKSVSEEDIGTAGEHQSTVCTCVKDSQWELHTGADAATVQPRRMSQMQSIS